MRMTYNITLWLVLCFYVFRRGLVNGKKCNNTISLLIRSNTQQIKNNVYLKHHTTLDLVKLIVIFNKLTQPTLLVAIVSDSFKFNLHQSITTPPLKTYLLKFNCKMSDRTKLLMFLNVLPRMQIPIIYTLQKHH